MKTEDSEKANKSLFSSMSSTNMENNVLSDEEERKILLTIPSD